MAVYVTAAKVTLYVGKIMFLSEGINQMANNLCKRYIRKKIITTINFTSLHTHHYRGCMYWGLTVNCFCLNSSSA